MLLVALLECLAIVAGPANLHNGGPHPFPGAVLSHRQFHLGFSLMEWVHVVPFGCFSLKRLWQENLVLIGHELITLVGVLMLLVDVVI